MLNDATRKIFATPNNLSFVETGLIIEFKIHWMNYAITSILFQKRSPDNVFEIRTNWLGKNIDYYWRDYVIVIKTQMRE
jgi:hypothetical protein